MNYYKLTNQSDSEDGNEIFCYAKNDNDIDYLDMITAKDNVQLQSNFYFSYNLFEGDIKTDLLSNNKGWILASEGLKSIFQTLTEKLSFIEVSIIDSDNNELNSSYFIINILTIIDALLLEKSTYFTLSSQTGLEFPIVSNFAVSEKSLNGIDVFKLPDPFKQFLFVSEKFRNIVIKENISGIKFEKITVIH